jgi:chemotaxis protein methyltransferase CheR
MVAGTLERNQRHDAEIGSLLGRIRRDQDLNLFAWHPRRVRHRVHTTVEKSRLVSVAGLEERLFTDPVQMRRFMQDFRIGVTGLFRAPAFWRAFRREAVPILRRCYSGQIWHAGCSTGEEVYSMAMLLAEEDLLPRCRIHSTDESLGSPLEGALVRLDSKQKIYRRIA